MTIWFDMDGTIADLYGVENWLDYILAGDTFPYDAAKPLLNMNLLARYLNKIRELGYEIGVISWTAKNGSDLYNGQVAMAKMVWLNKHLKSVTWDEIKIVPYGTHKYRACNGGILFDDEIGNREAWGDGAYKPNEIFTILKGLLAL